MTSIGLLPVTQGLGIPPTDPHPLGLEIPMGPRHFEPSDLHSSSYYLPAQIDMSTQLDMFAPGAAARPYANDAQSPDLDPFLPPPNMGDFYPHRAVGDFTTASATAQSVTSSLPSRKRSRPPVPAHDKRGKRRKPNGNLVDQPVRDPQGDRLSVAVTSHASVPAADQGLVNAITQHNTVPLFNRPEGMPRDEYLRMLHAEIAAEHNA